MLDAETLRKLLDYNPDTGMFRWRVTRTGKALKGSIAGALHVNRDGYRYIRIRINGKLYVAHRLAWLYVYGAWPSKQLDHMDEDATNNRIYNLREADPEENIRNRGIQSNNRSGYKGVRFKSGKWEASIKIAGKQSYLGRFANPAEAHAAYCEAAKKYHGEFFNPGTAMELRQHQKMISAQRS